MTTRQILSSAALAALLAVGASQGASAAPQIHKIAAPAKASSLSPQQAAAKWHLDLPQQH